MSLDILKMLIESACAEGEPMEDDKVLLKKKAAELGISESELNKMISAKVKGEDYIPVMKKTEIVTEQAVNMTVPQEDILPEVLKEKTFVKTENRNKNNISVVEKEPVKEISTKQEEKFEIPPVFNEPVKEIKKEPIIVSEPVKEVKTENFAVSEPIKEIKTEPVKNNVQEGRFENKQEFNTNQNTPKKDNNNNNQQPAAAGKSKLVPIIIVVLILVLGVGGFLLKDKIFGKEDKTTEVIDNNTENNNTTNSDSSYDEFMKKGNDAFGAQNFLEAKNNYEKALEAKSGDAKATEMKNKMQIIIALQNEAEEAYNKKNVARAKARFDSLLTIAPDISNAIEKRNKCKEIIDKAKNLTCEQETQGGKYGFADADNYVVIDYTFADAKNFNRGVAPVKNSVGKWGFIGENFHKAPTLLIDHKFDKVWVDRGKYQASIEGEGGYIYDISFVNGKLKEARY